MGIEVEPPQLEAWYMDDLADDQRLPHHTNPMQYVSLETLADLGVLYWKLDADNSETDPELQEIRKSRGYNYTDILAICPDKLTNYHEKIKRFYEEHLHTDEEIRYCLEGSAGIYHRFTLDTSNYIKVMRLFQGEPVWTAYNRPYDDHPARKTYVHQFVKQSC